MKLIVKGEHLLDLGLLELPLRIREYLESNDMFSLLLRRWRDGTYTSSFLALHLSAHSLARERTLSHMPTIEKGDNIGAS